MRGWSQRGRTEGSERENRGFREREQRVQRAKVFSNGSETTGEQLPREPKLLKLRGLTLRGVRAEIIPELWETNFYPVLVLRGIALLL